MLKIAILGAESSGKSTLAQQLAQANGLKAKGTTVLIAEPLRQWCADQKRTPSASEQVALMATHIQQCDRAMSPASNQDPQPQTDAGTKAQAQGLAHTDLLICDTTALQTAAYQFYYFGETGLDCDAIAHHQRFDFTLLMGLDLPWVADPGQRSGPASQAPVDQRLRYLLDAAKCPYAVIYGTGDQRLAMAMGVLARLNPIALDVTASKAPTEVLPSSRPLWRPHCETCGNAECERRLFFGLKGCE
jgi:nicotinamide riboside kinase